MFNTPEDALMNPGRSDEPSAWPQFSRNSQPTTVYSDCDKEKERIRTATAAVKLCRQLSGDFVADDDMKSPKANIRKSSGSACFYDVPEAVFVHRVVRFLSEEDHYKARLTSRLFNKSYTLRTYGDLDAPTSRRLMRAGTEARVKIRARGCKLEPIGAVGRPRPFLDRFQASLLVKLHMNNYPRLNLDREMPEKLPNLRDLTIEQCGITSVAVIGSYPKLQRLLIQKNNHRKLDLSTLPGGSVPRIQELELGQCGLTDCSELRRVAPYLEQLTIVGNRNLQIETLPAQMPLLRTLKLEAMLGGGIIDASHLECYAETLECLLLPYNRGLQIASLPTRMPRLWWLNIGQCGLRDVSDLRHFPTLERLVLFGNHLDLKTLPQLPKLREMCLEGTGLRDASPLERFADTIETISLSHNRHLDITSLPTFIRLKLMNLVDCGVNESAITRFEQSKLVRKNFPRNWKINCAP